MTYRPDVRSSRFDRCAEHKNSKKTRDQIIIEQTVAARKKSAEAGKQPTESEKVIDSAVKVMDAIDKAIEAADSVTV